MTFHSVVSRLQTTFTSSDSHVGWPYSCPPGLHTSFNRAMLAESGEALESSQATKNKTDLIPLPLPLHCPPWCSYCYWLPHPCSTSDTSHLFHILCLLLLPLKHDLQNTTTLLQTFSAIQVGKELRRANARKAAVRGPQLWLITWLTSVCLPAWYWSGWCCHPPPILFPLSPGDR